jgi:hypothetical protein
MTPFAVPQFRPAGYAQKPGQPMRRLAQEAPAAAPAQVTQVTTQGYQGFPGIVETLLVLGISGAAAYTGVRTGLNKGATKLNRGLGWAGGVGGALIGLLYLGSKASVGGIPQVRVLVPSNA